jgi:hydrogenase-4 membrane subunit HyfE
VVPVTVDYLMMAVWFITAVSTTVVATYLAIGVKQNHVKGHFRAFMSTLFLIAGTQAWFAWDKTLLRAEHICGYFTTALLTDPVSVVSTSMLALAWGTMAYLMVTNGRQMKGTITKPL